MHIDGKPRKTLLGVVLGFGAGLAAMSQAADARADGDPVAGQEKAIKWCARCHVVGAQNPYGGINSTPSFYIMSEKPESYRERVLSVQERRPHIAQTLELKNEDLDDILAYILTLERP